MSRSTPDGTAIMTNDEGQYFAYPAFLADGPALGPYETREDAVDAAWEAVDTDRPSEGSEGDE